MDAIVTKYHGPTNTRGSRISGTCGEKRVYVSYDYALDTLKNHERAARAILAKVTTGLPAAMVFHREIEAATVPYAFAELGHGFVYIFDLFPRARKCR